MPGPHDDRYEPLAAAYEPLAEVVRRAGHAYPCAVEPLAATLDGLVVVGARRAALEPRLAERGRPHLERLLRQSRQLHDGTVLALDTIENGRLTTCTASYFEMLISADSLRAEYAELETPSIGPLRRLAHDACGGDPLHRGAGRAAAVGVSVALVAGDGDDRALLLGRRRADLAADPGRWHVAPSGMLEPGGRDGPLRATLAAELEHELVALAGAPVAELERLVTGMRVLGFGHDLLRLKPELCLVAELERLPVAAPGGELAPAEFERSLRVPIGAGFEPLWRRFGPDDLTPAAAATIALLERARGG